MTQPHRGNGLRSTLWFVGIDLTGPARLHVTERTCPGAFVSEEHERAGAGCPALVDVGAARLLAHRVELFPPHQSPHLPVTLRRDVGFDAHPLGSRRLARQEPVDGNRDLGGMPSGEDTRFHHGVDRERLTVSTPGKGPELNLESFLTEHPVDVWDEHFNQVFDGDRPVRDFGNRRDRAVGDAARNDLRKVPEIGVNVDGKAVHGHSTGDPDPDRCNLATCGPDSGETLLCPRVDTEVPERTDDRFLDPPHVTDHVESVRETRDRKDRIAHELSGAVVCDVTTTINMMDLGSDVAQIGFGNQQVGPVAVAADGIRMRMFQEEQIVVTAPPAYPALPEGLLEVPGLCIWQPSQPADTKLCRRHANSWSQSHVSRFSLIRRKKRTAVDPSKTR